LIRIVSGVAIINYIQNKAQEFSSYSASDENVEFAYLENDRINKNLYEIQSLSDKIIQNSEHKSNTPRLTRFINAKHRIRIAQVEKENRLLMNTRFTIDDIDDSAE